MLDHYVTQYLTGHGNFKTKLFGFGLVDDPNCTYCQVEETMEHVLWDCKHYSEERCEFEVAIDDINARINLINLMKTCEKQKKLFKLMKDIGKSKETEEKEIGQI